MPLVASAEAVPKAIKTRAPLSVGLLAATRRRYCSVRGGTNAAVSLVGVDSAGWVARFFFFYGALFMGATLNAAARRLALNVCAKCYSRGLS